MFLLPGHFGILLSYVVIAALERTISNKSLERLYPINLLNDVSLFITLIRSKVIIRYVYPAILCPPCLFEIWRWNQLHHLKHLHMKLKQLNYLNHRPKQNEILTSWQLERFKSDRPTHLKGTRGKKRTSLCQVHLGNDLQTSGMNAKYKNAIF